MVRSLNDPIDAEPQSAEWTPAIGLRRGATHGVIAAAITLAPISLLMAYQPYFALAFVTRTGMAFLLTWIFLSVVTRGAGMCGWHCSAIAAALATLCLLSNHVVLALFGAPDPAGLDSWWVFPAPLVAHLIKPDASGSLVGWGWFHPVTLFAMNGLQALIGIGFAISFFSRA